MLTRLSLRCGHRPRGLMAAHFPVLIAALVLICATVRGQVDLNEINPFGDDPTAETPATVPADQPEQAAQPTLEEFFNQGKALAEEGRCTEAIKYFSSILAQAPNYAPAALEQGKCFAEIGEKQLALESLGLAVNYGQRFPPELYAEALAERGKVFLDLGNFQEAVDDFTLAVQTSPANPEYLFLRGKSLNRLARTPSSAYSASGPAEFFMQAIASLDRAIEMREDYGEAYVERGDAQSAIGNFDESIADLSKALELDPDNSQIMAKLGFALIRRADTERTKHDADSNKYRADYRGAIDAFSSYLAKEGGKGPEAFEDEDPEFLPPDQIFLARSVAQVSLGNTLEEGQDELYAAARDDAKSAYAFDNNSVAALFQQGLAERLLGDLDAAAESFTNALNMNPSFSEAQLRRGIVYFYLGEYELARGDFRQVIEFSEAPDGRAQFWTGATLAKQDRWLEAIRMYSKALRINRNYTPAYNNRGLTYLQMGDYERAERDFSELLRRNINDNVARQRRDMARQMMK